MKYTQFLVNTLCDEKTKERLCIYGKIKDVENAHRMCKETSVK